MHIFNKYGKKRYFIRKISNILAGNYLVRPTKGYGIELLYIGGQGTSGS